MIVHFWEVLDPRPSFLCGEEPRQGVRNAIPAMRVTSHTFDWFRRHRRPCKNCLRVARARLARLSGRASRGGRETGSKP